MSDNSFPFFNHKKLIEYAGRWAKRYPKGFVEKIILYYYASTYQEYFLNNISTQFAVVFEVAEPRPKILSFINKHCLRFEVFKPAGSKIDFGMIFEAWEKRYGYMYDHANFKTTFHAWKKIEDDTEQNWTIHEGYPALIHSDFEYIFNPPRKPVLTNWKFLIKPPNSKLPEGVKTDESKLVLFYAGGLERKPRKDTQIRDKCREIAKRIWTRDMTANDIYKHPEIIKTAGKKLPTLKTFRDLWMKDLNPKTKT